jgi:organic radical activating enzyme
MNEQGALARMVAPGTHRPHIWRHGVMQIHTTRACDKTCFGCTQGSNLGGKPVMITVEEFETAVLSLKGYFGVVGVFGGNPAMHPKFDELCAVLRRHVPLEQRGLWCNHPKGKGDICKETFNPAVSNLNVHQDRAAYDEFARDWPQCKPFLKGLDTDSRHTPPFVAMSDVIPDESERWQLIADCDINKNWSAMICTVPGHGLRAYFCEIAAAQAMLHAGDPAWPDTGLEVTPGWWKQPMHAFAAQVRLHCHACGIPLRRFGQLANGGDFEEVSDTHAAIFTTKTRGRRVELITVGNVGGRTLPRSTDYIENGSLT